MVISIFKDQSENERVQRAWDRSNSAPAAAPPTTPMGTLALNQWTPQQAPQQWQRQPGPMVGKTMTPGWQPDTWSREAAAPAPYMGNEQTAADKEWRYGAEQAGKDVQVGGESPLVTSLGAKKVLPEVKKTDREKSMDALAGTFSTREMTWDEYNALGARQKATVDANTAILDAVAADQAEWGGKARPEDKDYDALVQGMFGKGGGSDSYAPKTAAVLASLGISDTKRGDLDNYLNQTALVSDDDLAQLTDENIESYSVKEVGFTARDPRIANAITFSGAAESNLTASLQKGQSLLENLSGAATPIGFNPAEPTGRDNQLNMLFEGMARRPGHPEGNLDEGQVSKLYSEFQTEYGTDTAQLQDYFERRLKQVETGGDYALDTAKYLSPDEFRSQFYSGGQ